VLQEVLVQKVSDLHPADKRKCKHLTTIGDLGKLALEEVDVGFEAISRPHPDREEMMTTPLGFLASDVLFEEDLSDFR